jgi:hypothetical protein
MLRMFKGDMGNVIFVSVLCMREELKKAWARIYKTKGVCVTVTAQDHDLQQLHAVT